MELKQFTERIYYYPHEPETDRPNLCYIKGDKYSLAIDAGNSGRHVEEFYNSLEAEGLRKPDFTAITHWHWGHTFGMHKIEGVSIANVNTDKFLEIQKSKTADNEYIEFLKSTKKYLNREYQNGENIVVVTSDIQFDSELTIDLGGLTAKIFHTESPHSPDTVLILIPEEKVLFLGDSTSEDPYDNYYMDHEKLNKLIDTIENTDCEYCILGHAEPLRKDELLEYLRSI